MSTNPDFEVIKYDTTPCFRKSNVSRKIIETLAFYGVNNSIKIRATQKELSGLYSYAQRKGIKITQRKIEDNLYEIAYIGDVFMVPKSKTDGDPVGSGKSDSAKNPVSPAQEQFLQRIKHYMVGDYVGSSIKTEKEANEVINIALNRLFMELSFTMDEEGALFHVLSKGGKK